MQMSMVILLGVTLTFQTVLYKHMQQTTDNQYSSLLDRLNRIPIIIPELAKREYSVKQAKQMLYEDLITENGEATW